MQTAQREQPLHSGVHLRFLPSAGKVGLLCVCSALLVYAVAPAVSPVQCGDHWTAAALQPGEVHVYAFEALRGQHIVFETFQDPSWPRPVNTQVTLVDATSGVVIASNNDKAFGDLFSRLAACIPLDGSYEAHVDVSPGTWPGAYDASLTCAAPFLHQDDCTESGEFTCGALFYENVSRCLGNDFDPGERGCTGFAATGGDAVLGLRVEAGWRLDVTLQSTADAALYLAADCQDIPGSCVAGVDRGGAGAAETLRHQFHEAGFWYLILDHHGNGQGDLLLTGALSCATVAVQEATWTQVRRLYQE